MEWRKGWPSRGGAFPLRSAWIVGGEQEEVQEEEEEEKNMIGR
jgi:hypothetical protein